MTTYRTGTDGGFPLPVIVREHPAEAVAVVVNGDQGLAERIYARGATDALALVADRIADAAEGFTPHALGTLGDILEGVAASLGVDEDAPPSLLTANSEAVTCGIVAREPERTADCSLHTGWADKDGGWIDCSPDCAGNQRKADQA